MKPVLWLLVHLLNIEISLDLDRFLVEQKLQLLSVLVFVLGWCSADPSVVEMLWIDYEFGVAPVGVRRIVHF